MIFVSLLHLMEIISNFMTTVVIARIPGSVHEQFVMSVFQTYVPVVARTQIGYFHYFTVTLKNSQQKRKLELISQLFPRFSKQSMIHYLCKIRSNFCKKSVPVGERYTIGPT